LIGDKATGLGKALERLVGAQQIGASA